MDTSNDNVRQKNMESIWEEAKELIKNELPTTVYSPWLKDDKLNPIAIKDKGFYIECKDDMTFSIVSMKHYRLISECISEAAFTEMYTVIVPVQTISNHQNAFKTEETYCDCKKWGTVEKILEDDQFLEEFVLKLYRKLAETIQ